MTKYRTDAGDEIDIEVSHAHGAKCTRCWRYTRCWSHECFTGLGPICGRCREVVDALLDAGIIAANHPAVVPVPAEAPCQQCDGPCSQFLPQSRTG